MNKTKPSPLPTTVENDLPEGWTLASVLDIADLIRGVSYSKGEAATEPDSGRVALLRANNIGDGLNFDDLQYVPIARVGEEQYLRPGDVVLAMSSGSKAVVGKAASFHEPWQGTFGAFCGVLRPFAGSDPRYFGLFFQTRDYRTAISDVASGTNINNLKREHFADLLLLLPPLAEQKRIVAKVEALLARVNAARARLARMPAILKRFRQSVLAAACSGQLTADWREGKNLESTARLLTRMHDARPTKADLGAEFPVKRWRMAAPRQPQFDDLPSIPETWAWVYLPDLGYMNRGRSRNRPRNAPHLYGGKYPFIQTGDIARSGGRIVSHKQTYSEAGLAQSRLWPAGTICITIAANIADSAILTYPACFPDSVVGLITDPELCVAEFAEFFIRTAREDLSQFAPATAQKNINIGILEEAAVPLPPLDEQWEIVRRVEALFALADKIEARVQAATARVEKTTQAILAKAFRGELVPTEAELARAEGRDYEPATALLARIRAACAVNQAKPKKTRRRTKR